MKRLFIGIAIVLAGCGGPAWQWQYRADANFERDWYQCQRENRVLTPQQDLLTGAPLGPGMEVDRSMAIACMEARGWKRVPK
jgi:hypothetical protein